MSKDTIEKRGHPNAVVNPTIHIIENWLMLFEMINNFSVENDFSNLSILAISYLFYLPPTSEPIPNIEAPDAMMEPSPPEEPPQIRPG